MANFGPKPWTNPFGKISIFRLFELLVLIYSLERRFFRSRIELVVQGFFQNLVIHPVVLGKIGSEKSDLLEKIILS